MLGLYALVMSAVLGGFWLLLVVAGSSVVAGFALLLFTAITGRMGAFSEVSTSTGGMVVVSALCVLLASVASMFLVLVHPADD